MKSRDPKRTCESKSRARISCDLEPGLGTVVFQYTQGPAFHELVSLSLCPFPFLSFSLSLSLFLTSISLPLIPLDLNSHVVTYPPFWWNA